MAGTFRKIPQPAIDRSGRASESRPAWVGLVVSLAGAFLIVVGAIVSHHVENQIAADLPESELVRAARIGGIGDTESAATDPGETPPPKTREKPEEFCPT